MREWFFNFCHTDVGSICCIPYDCLLESVISGEYVFEDYGFAASEVSGNHRYGDMAIQVFQKKVTNSSWSPEYLTYISSKSFGSMIHWEFMTSIVRITSTSTTIQSLYPYLASWAERYACAKPFLIQLNSRNFPIIQLSYSLKFARSFSFAQKWIIELLNSIFIFHSSLIQRWVLNVWEMTDSRWLKLVRTSHIFWWGFHLSESITNVFIEILVKQFHTLLAMLHDLDRLRTQGLRCERSMLVFDIVTVHAALEYHSFVIFLLRVTEGEVFFSCKIGSM